MKKLIVFLLLIFVLGIGISIEKILAESPTESPVYHCPNLSSSLWCQTSTCIGQQGLESKCFTWKRWQAGWWDITCTKIEHQCKREPVKVEAIPFGQIIDRIHQGLLVIAGLAAIAMLVWAGFRFLFAAGSPIATKEAKKGILSVVLGLLIIIFSIGMIRIFVGEVRYVRAPPPPPEIPPPPPTVIPPPVEPMVIEQPEEDPPPELKGLPKEKAEKKIETFIKQDEEKLRAERFHGFVLREFLDLAPLKISGERLIIRDLKRIFRPEKNVFETFQMIHVSIHHPRDKDNELIYQYGLIFFEEPNFRGKCRIMTDSGIWWHPFPGSVRSFVMPVESHYEQGDALIVYENPILKRTKINPETEEEILVGKSLSPFHKGRSILNPLEIKKRVPVSWHQVIDPQPFYSLKTVSDPGKYMIVLRTTHPHLCHIASTDDIADFRNLWWTKAWENAFFRESIRGIGGEYAASPETIQAIQVLRVY